MISDPAQAGYISYGDAVTDKQSMGGLGQMSFHSVIQAVGFIVIAVDTVLYFLGGISCGSLVSVCSEKE